METDKRQHSLYLTAKGRAAAEKAIACQRSFVAETIGRLPAVKLTSLDRLLVETRDLVRAKTADAAKVEGGRRVNS